MRHLLIHRQYSDCLRSLGHLALTVRCMQNTQHEGRVRLEACWERRDIHVPIVLSSLIGHTAFKSVPWPLFSHNAYLRPVDQDIFQTPPNDGYWNHPIASRSFAVFPPIPSVTIFGGFETIPPKELINPTGVTMCDLVDHIIPL